MTDRPAFGTRARRRTGTLGLTVPTFREPYFAELTALATELAQAQGLSVAVLQTNGDRTQEASAVNGAGFPEIDGVIAIPRALRVSDLTRRNNPLPVVLLGEHLTPSTFCHVTIDNRQAICDATAHVLADGRRRVALIGHSDGRPSDAATQREQGFQAVADQLGATAEVLGVNAFTAAEGYAAAMSLKEVPEAIVCINDSLALGVLAALANRGVRVPDEVAVIGCDDIVAASYSTPSLSTIAPDKTALVSTALSLLDKQIETPLAWTPDMEHVTVPHSLVVRNSSGQAASTSGK